MENENSKEKKVKYTLSYNEDSLKYSTRIEYPRPSAYGFPSRQDGPSTQIDIIDNHYVLYYFGYDHGYGNFFGGVLGVKDISISKEEVRKISLEKLLKKIEEHHSYRDSLKYEINFS